MAAEFWDDLGRKISDAADVVGRKTGELASAAKLKNQVYSLEREIKCEYEKIGRAVYEQYLDTRTVDESFRESCEDIARREILIDQYNGELEQMKEKK